MLVVFGADWCGPCKELKAKTLDSREFNEQAGALHIAEVDVDAEAGTGPRLRRDGDADAGAADGGQQGGGAAHGLLGTPPN